MIKWIIATLLMVSNCLAGDIYDMTPAEPKIRVVISADNENQSHQQMLKTAKELQKNKFNVLIQNKKEAKLKTIIYIGREAKQETTETLTKEQIVDWILAVAVERPIPEKSVFKLCTDKCPEGTCETIEKKEKEQEEEQVEYVPPRRLFRIFR